VKIEVFEHGAKNIEVIHRSFYGDQWSVIYFGISHCFALEENLMESID
jgi:hypothetical protein